MFGLDIFERAEFQNTELKFSIKCPPGKTSSYTHSLPLSSFCLEYVEWKYEVPAGQGDYGWPRRPMEINLADCIERQTASPVNFSPPAVISEQLVAHIANPSELTVIVHLKLKGVLIAHKDKDRKLSKQEMLGYCLLDNSQKGLLALQGASTAFAFQEGQDQTPAFPEKSPQALEDSTHKIVPDAQKLKTILIGDLVQFKLMKESSISLEEIDILADYLLEKSWVKYE
jgi:hypothetical protein